MPPMLAMKTTLNKPKIGTRGGNVQHEVNAASRSVKVSDDIHYRLRVIAAQKRMGIQEFIEKLLLSGLKRYEIAPETE
jgi:hypothetical protein